MPSGGWEVPAEGLEPTHSCEYWILSPARLPFRHAGVLETERKNTSFAPKLKRFRSNRVLACFGEDRKSRAKSWRLANRSSFLTILRDRFCFRPVWKLAFRSGPAKAFQLRSPVQAVGAV